MNEFEYAAYYFIKDAADCKKSLEIFKRLVQRLIGEGTWGYVEQRKRRYLVDMVKVFISIVNDHIVSGKSGNAEVIQWINKLALMLQHKTHPVENVLHYVRYDIDTTQTFDIQAHFACPNHQQHTQLHLASNDCSNMNKRMLCEDNSYTQTKSDTIYYQCECETKHIICKRCCIGMALQQLLLHSKPDFIHFMSCNIHNDEIVEMMFDVGTYCDASSILFNICNDKDYFQFIPQFMKVAPKESINKVLVTRLQRRHEFVKFSVAIESRKLCPKSASYHPISLIQKIIVTKKIQSS